MSARRIVPAFLSVGLVAALAGCTHYAASSQEIIDAATPPASISQARLLDMPPGFGSVLTACHEGNRIYLVEYGEGYAGSPVSVVAADPTCAAGA